MSTRGLGIAGRNALGWFAPALILVIVTWWWYVLAVQGSPGDWGFDFRQFWQGAHDVVNGISPYPDDRLLATAGDHLDPEGIREVFRFPYPAGAAVLLAPLGLLSFHLAAAVWSALLIVSLLVAVRILGVRDWRVLAVVVAAAPVITAVRLGTLTPVLILLLAVAWRWRNQPWISGGSLAVAISVKLFLWPLVFWLAATRRFAAAVIAAACSAVLTLVSWAAIGFEGFLDYPDLVRTLTNVVADRGLSLVALGTEAGLSRGAAEVLQWLLGAILLACVVVLARREDRERASFGLAVVAAIALTPIVWLHYFAFLVIPLALARPRFSWAWGLLWVFWLIPGQENQGDLWRVVLATAVAGAVALVGLRTSRPRPRAELI